MPSESPTPVSTQPSPAAAVDPLEAAFAALTAYRDGSGRGPLVPLDEAVQKAAPDALVRRNLEDRFVRLLSAGLSPVAQVYVCAKLGWIGGGASVPALGRALAGPPEVAHAARAALESLASPESVDVLRERLERSGVNPEPGLIRALGRLRDSRAVPLLIPLAEQADSRIAAAAAEALGAIASPRAGEALRALLPKQAGSPSVVDACLVAAERLRVAGEEQAARAIEAALHSGELPPHLRRLHRAATTGA